MTPEQRVTVIGDGKLSVQFGDGLTVISVADPVYACDVLRRAIAEAIADEREACVKIIDDVANDWRDCSTGDVRKAYAAEYLATLIRERGQ